MAVGCGDVRVPETSPAVAPVLTEHRPSQALAATKSVGEDCTQAGASECTSGVCLHVRPQRESGYVCSQRCVSSAECPPQWRCSQIYPGPNNQMCVPPAS
ncbi:hypothetical protein HPC49_05420 [Pyxidicoccus fallax]|uniref:Uncharacterized protein n=1 Tax=Pyxidicoccus fallax TaxID=394095 RepID=A0A848L901_9BACT|nr:hypothetical protein [Pyxidicoccus fallax]NMO14732.1 hypothetical protein [Pyxidicoccus fallax]NPC77693.1 hypothetical protein [Pyxidicoccus fallax]